MVSQAIQRSTTQCITDLVQHEALAVESDADPFGVAIHGRFSDLHASVRAYNGHVREQITLTLISFM